MKTIAVALAMMTLAASPTLAQTHRQSETVNRLSPPDDDFLSSQLGSTGEYNGRSEERGGN